ncbi:MAG TPA: 2OG-Fe(II) oxygenase [bacterium]|nr:2OG-Fe(II) oxygenase [bacterium]
MTFPPLFWLRDLLGLRKMRPISRLYRYDDKEFGERVPPESRFLNSFTSDLPVFLKEGVLDPETCDRLAKELRASGSAGWAPMSKPEGDKNTALFDKKGRHTEFLNGNREILEIYLKAMAPALKEAEEFFGVKLGRSDGVQALGYPPGGRYELHADNCSPKYDARGKFDGWVCNMPRRVISTVLSLTETASNPDEARNQCSGGELSFPCLLDAKNRPLKIAPKRGLFIAFPSTPYFLHRVHPVKKGYRVTLVDWYGGTILAKADVPNAGAPGPRPAS